MRVPTSLPNLSQKESTPHWWQHFKARWFAAPSSPRTEDHLVESYRQFAEMTLSRYRYDFESMAKGSEGEALYKKFYPFFRQELEGELLIICELHRLAGNGALRKQLEGIAEETLRDFRRMMIGYIAEEAS